MNVENIDERALGEQGYGSNFVMFIYEGGDSSREELLLERRQARF